MDHVLEAVDGGDLALLVLVGAADDGDLVVLADGDAADLYFFCKKLSEDAGRGIEDTGRVGSNTYVVLLTQLLAERGAHDVAADARGGLEVRLAGLAPRRVEGCGNHSIVSILDFSNANEKGIENILLETLAIVMELSAARTGWSGSSRRLAAERRNSDVQKIGSLGGAGSKMCVAHGRIQSWCTGQEFRRFRRSSSALNSASVALHGRRCRRDHLIRALSKFLIYISRPPPTLLDLLDFSFSFLHTYLVRYVPRSRRRSYRSGGLHSTSWR